MCRRVAVDLTEHGAGKERPEDRLETDVGGEGDEPDEQGDGDPHPDLGRSVLEGDEHGVDPHAAPGPGECHGDGGDDGDEQRHRDQPARRAALGLGEQERQQQHGAEIGDCRAGDGELPDGSVGESGVLEHRDHEAE
jgi:hypothetical protein